MQHDHAHPYRETRDLRALIPPDRRGLKAALLAFTCLISGAVLLAATEAAVAAADEPDWHLVRADRGLELLNGGTALPPQRPLAFGSTGRTSTDLAREAALRGDAAVVKNLLINAVAAGVASEEDERLVRAACRALHDQPCLELLKR